MYAIYRWSVTPSRFSVDGKTHRRKVWFAGDRTMAGFYFSQCWDRKEQAVLFDRKAEADRVARMIQKTHEEKVLVQAMERRTR